MSLRSHTKIWPLNHGQLSLLRARALNPDPVRFQCAELMQCEYVDAELLAECIRYASAEVDQFSAILAGTEEQPYWQKTEEPVRVEIISVPTGAAHTQPGSAPGQSDPTQGQPNYDDYIKNAQGLSEHFIFSFPDGSGAWLARFDHLIGDAFSFQAFIRWISQLYTARIHNQPDPPHSFSIPEEEDIHTVNADEWLYTAQEVSPLIRDVRSMRPAPRGNTVTRAYACAYMDTPLDPITLYQRGGEFLCRVAHTDHYTFGIPFMNRPMGTRTITTGSRVTIMPFVYGGEENIAQQLTFLSTHSYATAENIRAVMGLTDPRVPLTGAHINFRPFIPRLTLGEHPVTFTTLALGPVDDIEFAFNTGPGGLVELYCFAYIDHRDQPLLEDVAKHCIQFITTGKMLSDDSHKALLSFNNTQRELPHTTLSASIEKCIRTAFRSEVHYDFLWYKDHFYSNHEVYHCVLHLADYIYTHSVGEPDQPIIISLPRSPELLYAIAAVSLLGRVWIPVAPDLPESRREYMYESSGAQFIIDQEYMDHAHGEEAIHSTCTCEEILDKIQEYRGRIQAESPSYMLFTSGSTGKPKCAINTQQGIVNRLQWMVDDYDLDTNTRIMQKTACSFDVSVWELLLPFTHGIPVAVASDGVHKDPSALAQEIQHSGTTHCHFVPSALKVFLSISSEPIGSLTTLFTSGEALSTDIAMQAMKELKVTIHNLYGPTEAAIDVTAHTVSGLEDTSIPIGRPVANTQMYVLDKKHQQLPIGWEGDIYIGGIQVGLGYFRRQALTDERFIPNPFGPGKLYDTGDKGYWTAEGELIYTGRSDFQIKLRGQRLEPEEIAIALRTHPAIVDSYVLAREVAGDMSLIAYYVAREEVSDLRDYLGALLPDYMVPSFFIQLDSIPLNASGKCDRHALPAPQISAQAEQVLNPQEEKIYRVFCSVLGLESFDATQSFFELGGTSLTAVTLIQELAQVGVDISLATLFSASSPIELARSEHDQISYEPIFPLRKAGYGTPVFCIYPAGGLGWTYTRILDYVEADQPVYIVQSDVLSGASLPQSINESAEKIIRHINSITTGECILVGWSVGGLLAHAVAAHKGMEKRVRIIHNFDSYPPQSWHDHPKPTDEQLLEGILNMAGIDTPEEELTKEKVVKILSASESIFAQLPQDILFSVVDLIRAHAHIMRTHEIVYADVPMIHHQALLNPEKMDPKDWEPYVSSMEYHAYECTHPRIIAVVCDSM